jgi:hypothetical protein
MKYAIAAKQRNRNSEFSRLFLIILQRHSFANNSWRTVTHKPNRSFQENSYLHKNVNSSEENSSPVFLLQGAVPEVPSLFASPHNKL